MNSDLTTRYSLPDDDDPDSNDAVGPHQDSDAPSSSQDDQPEEKKNALEWTVTGIGALIVLAVLAYLSYRAFFAPDQPANLQIELGTPTEDGPLAQIPVTITNTGDRVATSATIEVCNRSDECATLIFDYVPFHSSRSGVVRLGRPLAPPLTARVVSYLDP